MISLFCVPSIRRRLADALIMDGLRTNCGAGLQAAMLDASRRSEDVLNLIDSLKRHVADAAGQEKLRKLERDVGELTTEIVALKAATADPGIQLKWSNMGLT